MNFIFTLDTIGEAAAMALENAHYKKVWAVHGEMGAGKTTFIQAVCRHLGVADTAGSPTYSIINEYKSGDGTLYHIDLYRLKDEEEALQAGVEDCILSGNFCFVEWPEIASELLPDNCFHITLLVVGPQIREFNS